MPLFFLSASIIVRAEKVFFVNDQETLNSNNSFFLSVREEGNISGGLNQEALGLCLNDCSKSFYFSEVFEDALARMNGFTELTEEQKANYNLPLYPLIVETELIEKHDVHTSKNVFTEMLGMKSEGKKYYLRKTNLDIEFSNEKSIIPQRFSYEQVEPTHQALSTSTFQILGKSETHGLEQGDSHGTGFFISGNGHALTNLHVININPTCVEKKSCILNIKQKGGKYKEYSVEARILTCSKLNDFCLIKIHLPEKLNITPLMIQTNSIPLKLMTLGFPGDKYILNNEKNEPTEEIALTYSFGSPVGFFGRTVTSSLFISGGASGSPVLDSGNLRVVGLISNGAETLANEFDGAPGVFRTLYLIEQEFKISDYLNGHKQKFVEQIIKKLKETNNIEEAKDLLQSHKNEKTFYGMGKLKVLGYTHQSMKVRREITRYINSYSLNNW